MQRDSELRQSRAIDALDALEALFDSLPPGTDVPSCHVATLLGLAGEAVRAALPPSALLIGVNDDR